MVSFTVRCVEKSSWKWR